MAKPNPRSVAKKPELRNELSTSDARRQAERPTEDSMGPASVDLPLKRKLVWVYDTSSPEFQKIWAQEREALRRSGRDLQVEAFIEGTQNDPEARKWWR